MSITQKAIKLLWSNAAGRCSFPNCEQRLTVEQASGSANYTLGEMAHIKGNNPGSNRYDPHQPDEERDQYENLILLCPNHHTIIDKPENESTYSVQLLLQMKTDHEGNISRRLEAGNMSELETVKNEIAICLAENKLVWEQYGPLSDAARRNPHNDQIYAIWTTERLSTIVPNNRKIVNILSDYRNLFSRDKQGIISRFLLHTESYERWVKDEIPYQAVARFPVEFEELILES